MEKVTAWSIFEPFLTGNGNPFFIESIARDISRYANFHYAPALLRQHLSGELQPEYHEAAVLLDWLNDKFMPRLGIRQKFTLPELFPKYFTMPKLRDEVRLIIGRDAIGGKTVSDEDILHLFGQDGMEKFKALGVSKDNDGRYPTEYLFVLLAGNPDLELNIKPGDSVYSTPPPIKVELPVVTEDKPNKGKGK